MKIIINNNIFNQFQGLKIGIIILKNINNTKSIDTFINTLHLEIENKIKNKFADIELSKYQVVSKWREVYKSFGEKEARSSIEALIKRIKNNKGLYKINPLVDLYNVASLKFELPVGGEDLDKINDNIELTFANGDEEFISLGETSIEHPNKGEIIYKFKNTVICRNFNYRESEITKLTKDTNYAIIVLEDILGKNNNLEEAMNWLSEKTQNLLNAKIDKMVILSKENNEETIQ